jgi:hypothetical protein
MNLDMARINHKPNEVFLLEKLLQQFFPVAFVAPSTISPVRIFPAAVIRRQITPGRARAKNP